MAQAAILNTDRIEAKNTFDVNSSVGEILRESRMGYGISLEEVSHTLRIKPEHLDAIENNKFDRLPGPVYSMGFVRSYAEYLRLNPAKMVSLFKAQSGERLRPSNLNNLPNTKEDSILPPLWVVIISILMLGGVWFLWNSGASVESFSVPEPPAMELAHAQTADETISTIGISAKTLSEQPFGPPMPPTTVALRITQDSWIEIVNGNGQVLVSKILKAGEGYLLPNDPNMTLSTGNAGGVTLSVGNRPIKTLGMKGRVKRDIRVHPDDLIAIYGFADETSAPQTLQSLN